MMPDRGAGIHSAPSVAASSERVLFVTEEILIESWRSFREGARRGVESTLRWAGPGFQSRGYAQLVSTVLVPAQRVNRGFFEVPHDATRTMGATLGSLGLVNLAQLHTHPGYSVEHSEWDDSHAYSSREGALSIIWPLYGRHVPPFSDWGVHECRNSKWLQLDHDAAAARVIVLPSLVDLRVVMPMANSAFGHYDPILDSPSDQFEDKQ